MGFMSTLDDLNKANDLVRERYLARGDDRRLWHVEDTLAIIQHQMNSLVECTQAVVALLHDSVEDNIAKLPELEEVFGKQVAKDVEYLTEKPRRCRREFMQNVGYLRVTHRAMEVRLAARYENWSTALANPKDSFLQTRAKFYKQEYAFFKSTQKTPLYLADYWTRLDALAEERPEAHWTDETDRVQWGIGYRLDNKGAPEVG